MTKKERKYTRQIKRLENARYELSRQLDRFYSRGSMSDYIVLEDRYRSLVRQISSLRSRLSAQT